MGFLGEFHRLFVCTQTVRTRGGWLSQFLSRWQWSVVVVVIAIAVVAAVVVVVVVVVVSLFPLLLMTTTKQMEI